MNILFVCNQGIHRSRTAAELFSNKFNTKYAGIYNNLITSDMLEWADKVIVMEDKQRTEIANKFPKLYMQKQILSWDIPDIYSYNQPKLIQELKRKELS
jgi:predicted protein tyrosine phosphatase